ncbi:MAG: hypothetical protein J7J75_04930 [Euryarchaeota archaeon]|nr:hypothetical protein [Euryarchaeota archaeon]MCD6158965.1 hypothetical protein [Euryarchaeota archaeon]
MIADIRRDPTLIYERIRFRSPTGVHVFYLDLINFSGGISIHLPTSIECEITLSPESKPRGEVEILGMDERFSGIMKQFIEEFLDILGLELSIKLEVEDSAIKDLLGMHALASLITSTINVLNLALNRPLDYRSLRIVIGNIARNLQTPVSPLLIDGSLQTSVLYECISIVVKNEVLVSKRIPGEFKAYLINLEQREQGQRHVIGEMKNAELQDKYLKHEIVLMSLYPALIQFNINDIRLSFNNLHFLGSKFTEILSKGLYKDIIFAKKSLMASDDVLLYALPTFSSFLIVISRKDPPIKSRLIGEYSNVKDNKRVYIVD